MEGWSPSPLKQWYDFVENMVLAQVSDTKPKPLGVGRYTFPEVIPQFGLAFFLNENFFKKILQKYQSKICRRSNKNDKFSCLIAYTVFQMKIKHRKKCKGGEKGVPINFKFQTKSTEK